METTLINRIENDRSQSTPVRSYSMTVDYHPGTGYLDALASALLEWRFKVRKRYRPAGDHNSRMLRRHNEIKAGTL